MTYYLIMLFNEAVNFNIGQNSLMNFIVLIPYTRPTALPHIEVTRLFHTSFLLIFSQRILIINMLGFF